MSQNSACNGQDQMLDEERQISSEKFCSKNVFWVKFSGSVKTIHPAALGSNPGHSINPLFRNVCDCEL